jgi:hypothetical protein
MSRFNSFSECWAALQGLHPTGMTNAWSVAGRTRSTFEIVSIGVKQVVVKPATGELRAISEREFEKVFANWQDYLSGQFSRDGLRSLTRNSTYIITLLHLIDIAP